MRLDEFIANLPELTFGLFDQTIHAVAGVEQDRDLHERLPGDRLFGRAAEQLNAEGEDGEKDELRFHDLSFLVSDFINGVAERDLDVLPEREPRGRFGIFGEKCEVIFRVELNA